MTQVEATLVLWASVLFRNILSSTRCAAEAGQLLASLDKYVCCRCFEQYFPRNYHTANLYRSCSTVTRVASGTLNGHQELYLQIHAMVDPPSNKAGGPIIKCTSHSSRSD